MFDHFAWVGTSSGIDVFSITDKDMAYQSHVGTNKEVVKQLVVIDGRIWAACNKIIQVWSVNETTGHSLQLIATLKPHLGRVECLYQIGMFVLLTFQTDPAIVLWNSKAFEYVATLVGNEKGQPSRGITMVDDSIMCTACFDKSSPVIVWRLRLK